ncbi:cystathionine beta-lyase [Pseudoalteromonas sp. SSM20]|uniref:cystathionine beta-lyase n=1 Tax=Pseudoalteromonas sp. SSM20 TaxID=3139394 RepID=UPI003BACA6AA
MKANTQIIHAGRKTKYTQGVVNPVVQRASTIVFDSVAQMKENTAKRGEQVLFYGRRGTHTHFALQDAIAELEQGAGCALFPSGAAAVSNAILSFVKTGDHILMVDTAYEPTRDFCDKILANMGVSTTYYDPMIGEGIVELIQDNTVLLFLEAPGSITMEVQDVPLLTKIAKAHDLLVFIDNTYGNGYFFKPLTHGVDVSIQAATKYIVGHSDVMMGVAIANEACWEQLRENAYLMGQCTSADDAYLALRGLRTMPVRLKQHEQAALEIANWLKDHPLVDHVRHPMLDSCPGSEVFKRDFSGSTGLFSFVLKEGNQAAITALLDGMSHFKMGYSWGGFESLITVTSSFNRIRTVTQWPYAGPLVRIHVGLEDVEDLKLDLKAGLERFQAQLK